MFRLTQDELAFKPVPLVAPLADLGAPDLERIPVVRQSGPFNAFSNPAAGSEGQQWVVRHPALDS